MNRAGALRPGRKGASSTRPASRPGKDCNPQMAGPRWSRYGRGPRPVCVWAAFRPRRSPRASPRCVRSLGRNCPARRGSGSSIACHFRPRREPTLKSNRRPRTDARQPGARGGYRRRRSRNAGRKRELMTGAPKERRRSPAWFRPRTRDPRLGAGHSAAYPGRTVFLPWWRTRHGSPERRGLGEIAGPCARPSCRRTRGRANRPYRSRTNPKAGAISRGFQSLPRDFEQRASSRRPRNIG